MDRWFSRPLLPYFLVRLRGEGEGVGECEYLLIERSHCRRWETKAANCRQCSKIFDNVRWHFDSVNEQNQAVVTFATQEAFSSSFSLALQLVFFISLLRCHKLRVSLL